jgi:hypothetical protein
MELIIPAIAVGGMWIINRTRTNNTPESFENINEETRNIGFLTSELDEAPNTPNYENNNYTNPNQTTDKFFINESNNQQQVYSLTGDTIFANDFKHNNMVPFFGSKRKGNIHGYDDESILDNKIGAASQQKKKIEQAPLFQPQDNLQFTHGTPNYNDFYQSRVNPSLKMSNVKPWKEEQVGPGLNLGYTTEGQHNSLEERALYMPKDVDQLRVVTNPKESYSLDGHEGPAGFYNPTRGTIGKVEKHLPDKFHTNDLSKWNDKNEYGLGSNIGFTTVGGSTRPTARAIEINKDENRETTSVQYEGIAKSVPRMNYSKDTYSQPNREDHGCTVEFTPANKNSQGNLGKSSYHILKNNRCVNKSNSNPSEYGFVGSAIGAVVAPLVDILKPSKKENVVGNIRIHGDVQSHVPNSYISNQNNIPVTNRTMIRYNAQDHYNINNQLPGGGYEISNNTPVYNQRDDTSVYYTNPIGNNAYGNISHEATNNQINNSSKETTTYNRIPVGNASSHSHLGYSHSICKTDSDRENNRMWIPQQASLSLPPCESTSGYRDNVPVEKIQQNRIEPDILKAFKENPFTKSLNSVA